MLKKLWEYGMISCDLGVHLKSQGQGYLPVLQQLRLHRRKVERSGQPRRLRSKQRRKAAWVTRLAKLDIPQKSYRFFLVSPVFNLLFVARFQVVLLMFFFVWCEELDISDTLIKHLSDC